MAEVPEQVRQVLLTYAREGDPAGIDDLAHDASKPALAWFPAEFERLLRAGGPSIQWWGKNLYSDDWTDEEAVDLDRDLRAIWTAVAAGRPYPLDAANT